MPKLNPVYGDIENAFNRSKKELDNQFTELERKYAPRKVEPLAPTGKHTPYGDMADFSEMNNWRRQGQQFNESQVGKATGKAKALGVGFGIGMGIDTIMNMREGDDFGTAAVKGAFTGMLYTTMPTVMFAKDVADLGVAAFQGYNNFQREKKQWWNQQFLPNFGGNYQDTRRAQTMRQSAVEAIQGSKLNARSALGGEAKIFSQNFNRG